MSAGAGPVDLYVDVAALEVLRDQVKRVRKHLFELTNGHDADWGDGGVAAAVAGFREGWREGRERIEGNLTEVETLIDIAIETYQQAERALVQTTKSAKS